MSSCIVISHAAITTEVWIKEKKITKSWEISRYVRTAERTSTSPLCPIQRTTGRPTWECDGGKNAVGKTKINTDGQKFYAHTHTHTNSHLYIFTYTILIYTLTHSFAIRIIFISTMTHGRPHKPYTCATTYRSFWFFFFIYFDFFFFLHFKSCSAFSLPETFLNILFWSNAARGQFWTDVKVAANIVLTQTYIFIYMYCPKTIA